MRRNGLSMAKALRFGQMVLSIQVVGVRTRFKVMENSFMRIKMSMKGNFMPIEPTDMESMFRNVVKRTKDIGLMINHTAKENLS